MKPEIRFFKGELRAERSSDGKVFIVGRVLSFNTLSENLGTPDHPIYERLLPGCLDDVDDSECVHCIDHDPTRLLGKVASGTTQLETDGRGLLCRTEAPNTSWARDLIELIRRGDAQFMSFSFNLDMDDRSAQVWSDGPDPKNPEKKAEFRGIAKIQRLLDVSILTGYPPAYPQTAAGLSDRFASAPAEVRARLFRAADDASSDECACDCQSCIVDGDCEGCTDEDCLDEACRAAGCPMQDGGDRSLPGDRGDVAAVLAESNELAFDEALEEL